MRETIGYKKNHNEREINDFYATPVQEVENILKHEDIKGIILEPCCGLGHMVKALENKGYKNIVATDLIDRGVGEGGLDFLDASYPYTQGISTVIINPPFKLIEEFVLKSLEIATDKVILFARNQFVEGQSRYNNIFKKNPPNRIYQYVDRVACAKEGDFNKKLSSNMAFSWFVWDKNCNNNKTIFKWIRRSDKVNQL